MYGERIFIYSSGCLVSTHEWGKSLDRLDRILLLNQRSIADSSPQQVMTSENFPQAYGTPLHQHTRHDVSADLFC
jgi:manganese/iron transport system ATP-binding protein